MIEREGIDLYRQDFNIDPLSMWRGNDAPDRQGMTEALYVEGLYAFWDELLRRHPNLIIDNCASGGRRLDFEMARRSVPLWRSDLQCSSGYNPTGSQAQTFALSSWLPFHTVGVRESADEYDFRSGISSGIVLNWPSPEKSGFPFDSAVKLMKEAYQLRPYFDGDFYPLTEHNISEHQWLAWQLDRPDLGEGVIMAFRRSQCPFTQAVFKLQGLDLRENYKITQLDTKGSRTKIGKELHDEGIEVAIKNKPDCIVMFYKKTDICT